ncbi:hypothetical protein CGZ69_10030 [Streptomyces peucetius subsp. caesius ATCC 27952]|nr:hypothetical protein CGZ69_10030 [Streptomyces peucetius subsp. caesius ATCC 27952]
MEEAERYALTILCKDLVNLRAECARQPGDRQRLLARIEAEARARRPVLELLEQLLGSPLEDPVRSLSSRLPGTGPGQADEERFACPDGACGRVCDTLPAGPVPRCLATDEPMRR